MHPLKSRQSRRLIRTLPLLPLLLGLAVGAALGAGGESLVVEDMGAAPLWQRDLVAMPSSSPQSRPSLLLTDAQLDTALSSAESAPSLSYGDIGGAPRRWWPLALSALVPGLGEVTTGHLRGYVFIAGDATSWLFVKKFSDEGEDKQVEFEAFADEHWSEDDWRLALFQGKADDDFGFGPGTDPDDPENGVPLWVTREEDEREYYENLGKWDVFWFGWDDGRDDWDDPPVEFMTPNRQHYLDLRGEHNDALKSRDRLLTINLLTRVVSVLDMAYLEGFIGGRFSNEMRGDAVGGALSSLGEGSDAMQISWFVEPRGLRETRVGLEVRY